MKNEDRGQRTEEAGPDVCRMQCKSGGECKRPVCTGACKLAEEPVKSIITAEPAGSVFEPPAWWTADDTRMAMASRDGHLEGCHGQCAGDFNACPLPPPCCEKTQHCRWCAYWASADGIKGECSDPAYDGERKRVTKAHRNFCGQFASRWASESEIAAADAAVKEFRVTQVRTGELGEDTYYLRIVDRDGDIDVFFQEGKACAWKGFASKAGVLVGLIRDATSDMTVRVEEVANG